MVHRLLLIESDRVAAEAHPCGFLLGDQRFRCERFHWRSLPPDRLACGGAHGILAVGTLKTPCTADLFHWLANQAVPLPSLAVLSETADAPLVRAAAAATDDFVLLPIRANEFHERLARLLGRDEQAVEQARERLLRELAMTQLVGRDPAFLDAIQQVPRFARSEVPVLITGETGTGKELCARAIHFLSRRRDHPFIAVDCGALPDHLVENELFGHARGAFTDAHRDQRGLVAIAEGGTLFLDEVDALSLPAQAKLLRFLQERTFRPLGAESFVQSDVHVIAATNRDLEACVRDKQFRPDLYFRLNVLRLHLPLLRERRGDISLLATHALEQHCASTERIARTFSAAALRRLASYDWPGNVRELCNVVKRAVVLCDGAQIQPHHLALPAGEPVPAGAGTSFRQARAGAIAAFERTYVEELLRKHHFNVTRAAIEAGKDRRAFGRLVKKYRIERSPAAAAAHQWMTSCTVPGPSHTGVGR
jgi:two-component system, NtrC family, response regulator GlrR